MLLLCCKNIPIGPTCLRFLASCVARAFPELTPTERDPMESLAAWADRGGRRANPHLIDIDSTADAIGLALAEPRFPYDLVIIDTASVMLSLIEEAIGPPTFVLIPSMASALDLVALDAVVDICREYNKSFVFVLNAMHPTRKLTKTAPGVSRKYGHLCETMIHDCTACVAAMTLGKGSTEVESDNAAAGELDALWAELEALMRGKR